MTQNAPPTEPNSDITELEDRGSQPGKWPTVAVTLALLALLIGTGSLACSALSFADLKDVFTELSAEGHANRVNNFFYSSLGAFSAGRRGIFNFGRGRIMDRPLSPRAHTFSNLV
jgi:hypothetical protein